MIANELTRSTVTAESRQNEYSSCFAGTRLEALLALQQFCEVMTVITVPGSLVHRHLESLGRPVFLVTKGSKDKAIDFLSNQQTNLVLSVGFPYILPATVLNSGPLFINSHPSLLPAYKGYNAIKEAFDAGEEYMGVTVHHMVEDVDAGPVIHQEKASVQRLNLEEIYQLIFGEVEPKAIRHALALLSQDGVTRH